MGDIITIGDPIVKNTLTDSRSHHFSPVTWRYYAKKDDTPGARQGAGRQFTSPAAGPGRAQRVFPGAYRRKITAPPD